VYLVHLSGLFVCLYLPGDGRRACGGPAAGASWPQNADSPTTSALARTRARNPSAQVVQPGPDYPEPFLATLLTRLSSGQAQSSQYDRGRAVDRTTLSSALRSYIAEKILEGDADSLDEKTPLLELGILDSFAIIELLSVIESDFGVQIGLDAVTPDRFADIEVIVDLILETQEARAKEV
jgi:peptidyl carrier protein